MPLINVNTDKAVIYSNKLEKASRSAFPVAVRQTLNQAAFDTKKKFLPQTVARTFVDRSPTFFSRFSAIKKASGFKVSSMSSTIGMIRKGQQASDDMEQQEFGGTLLASTESHKNDSVRTWLAETLSELASRDNVQLLPRSTVFGYYDHNFLAIAQRCKDHLWNPGARHLFRCSEGSDRQEPDHGARGINFRGLDSYHVEKPSPRGHGDRKPQVTQVRQRRDKSTQGLWLAAWCCAGKCSALRRGE